VYPDIQDIEMNLRLLSGENKPAASTIFADAVLTHSFINEARRYCYNRKRHDFVPVTDVQKLIEDFIGRGVNQWAVLVALHMLRIDTKLKSGVLSAKLPPPEPFEERRQQWHEHQIDLQKEIDEEIRNNKRF
jgi:hypothetical protein